VAASCLLPIVSHIVRQLPDSLPLVLEVLWSCLGDMKDDLSSSVGVVMDLLGKLVSHEEVISVLASEASLKPLTALAPTLFPFFRHTISSVRLAVVETLHSFMNVTSLPKDWVDSPLLRLLFQNLIVEERADIRNATIATWRTALDILASNPGRMQNVISGELLMDWFSISMTPMGVPLDPNVFFDPVADELKEGAQERHNVDKSMMAQDLTLVSTDTIWLARIAAAKAIAYMIFLWSPPVS
jgi:TATA-binding protein-associated factor